MMACARLRSDLKKLDGAIVGRIARVLKDPRSGIYLSLLQLGGFMLTP